MTGSRTPPPSRRPRLMAALSMGIGLVVALVLLEGVFRLLPVASGLAAQPVSDADPLFRFAPDRPFVWSLGPEMEPVVRGRSNNAGFISDVPYDAADPRPLLAVIGDSYVEALMVPWPETLAGRLAAQYGDRARAYAFGASGAPLSQYVAYAVHVRETYRPARLVIPIIANDFDESWLDRALKPGFHQLVPGADGTPVLRLNPYRPSTARQILRESALARYLVFNLKLPALFAGPGPGVGQTDASADPARLAAAEAAGDWFLAALPLAAGLSPGEIVLLVDGSRPQLYDPASRAAVRAAYWPVLRARFLARARAAGYLAIDLEPLFISEHQAFGTRFEFPNDGHWNAAGHELAARAALAQPALADWP